MVQTSPASHYSFREELLNCITHGAGVLLSIAALVLLVVFSSLRGGASHVVGSTIFGAALLLLYTASTLYHSFQKPGVKQLFKIFDHCCIYILIAGTYTPFLLVTLRGAIGWTLFGIIWFLAVSGIIFKSIICKSFQNFISDSVYTDGVDYHFRHQAACRCTGSRRHCLAGCGRTRLHHGSGFLCMEKAAFQPCHLASVRPVREHLPFFRCYFLCPSLKVIAACKHS